MTAPVVLDQSVAATTRVHAATRHWLVAPWFDSLLIANVAWPLLLLMQWREGFEGRAGLQFWQVYFVTTPHRWITLAIVFLDRERFHARRTLYLGFLVVIVAACSAVRWGTGALTCLLAIDYVWNAWHFAAQHQGIYRIYGRLNGASPGWRAIVERWAMRLFLLYVTLRVAIATWSDTGWESTFQTMDWLVPVVPLTLLIRDAVFSTRIVTGQTVYLLSVSTLYLSLLWAVNTHRPAIALSLTTASALFHALEYLSIVSWNVHNREAAHGERLGWLGVVASQWAAALCGFLVILGAGAWLCDQYWREQWLYLNVIVAFLHYAYDGVIWRHRPGSDQARQIAGASAR